jgi:hypothetical protein
MLRFSAKQSYCFSLGISEELVGYATHHMIKINAVRYGVTDIISHIKYHLMKLNHPELGKIKKCFMEGLLSHMDISF